MDAESSDVTKRIQWITINMTKIRKIKTKKLYKESIPDGLSLATTE